MLQLSCCLVNDHLISIDFFALRSSTGTYYVFSWAWRWRSIQFMYNSPGQLCGSNTLQVWWIRTNPCWTILFPSSPRANFVLIKEEDEDHHSLYMIVSKQKKRHHSYYASLVAQIPIELCAYFLLFGSEWVPRFDAILRWTQVMWPGVKSRHLSNSCIWHSCAGHTSVEGKNMGSYGCYWRVHCSPPSAMLHVYWFLLASTSDIKRYNNLYSTFYDDNHLQKVNNAGFSDMLFYRSSAGMTFCHSLG